MNDAAIMATNMSVGCWGVIDPGSATWHEWHKIIHSDLLPLRSRVPSSVSDLYGVVEWYFVVDCMGLMPPAFLRLARETAKILGGRPEYHFGELLLRGVRVEASSIFACDKPKLGRDYWSSLGPE